MSTPPAAGPDPSAASAAPSAGAPGEPRRPGSALRMFARSVLLGEAFVVLFATLAAFGLDLAAPAVVWAVGGVVMFWCLLAAGLLRGRAGYVLGTVVQVVLLASGFAIPMMFALAAVFGVLWLVALRSGRRIDAEREERYRAELDHFRASAR